jgi:hypothetical protein
MVTFPSAGVPLRKSNVVALALAGAPLGDQLEAVDHV